MLNIVQQPGEVSFARNPIVYRFQTLDANSQAYGGNGKIGRITFSTIDNLSLKFNEQFVISWNTLTENYSYTFTGHPTPTQQNEILSQPHALSTADYAQAWVSTLESHPVISAYFDIASFSFGNFVGIKFEDKTQNPDFDLSFGFPDADELDDSNYSTEDYAATNFPDNYKVKVDVFFQPEYPEGEWAIVTRIETSPDENGISEINLQDILNSEIENSQYNQVLPLSTSGDIILADNRRDYSIRYAEHFGTPQTEQWSDFGDTKKILCGGIDQERFAITDFFADLSEENSLLTWNPDDRTVSPAQPEYISWYNYLTSSVTIALRVKTYDQLNVEDEQIFDVNIFRVGAKETAIIPVGFNQLGFDDEDIRKYTVEVVNYIPSDVVATRVPYSQVRTFYLDCKFYTALKYILYLDAFRLPQIVRLIGATKKDLSVTRTNSNAIIGSNYTNLKREDFQNEFDWQNTYTFRSGWIRAAEVDALQQLLIYNQAFEIIDTLFRPLLIIDRKFNITEDFQFLHAVEFQAVRALRSKNYSKEIEFAADCCPGTALCIDNEVIEFANNLIITF